MNRNRFVKTAPVDDRDLHDDHPLRNEEVSRFFHALLEDEDVELVFREFIVPTRLH